MHLPLAPPQRCHPEQSLARLLRHAESKDPRLLFGLFPSIQFEGSAPHMTRDADEGNICPNAGDVSMTMPVEFAIAPRRTLPKLFVQHACNQYDVKIAGR